MSDQIILSSTLIALLCLFIWGKVRYDALAVGALFILVVLEIIPANEAFAGFAHPAVITVALVLIISQGLTNSGIAGLVGKLIGGREFTEIQFMVSLLFIAAILSSFINNIGALAILLPITLNICQKMEWHPSKFLMPLAFACILGGMNTAIGTPPNIIISEYKASISNAGFNVDLLINNASAFEYDSIKCSSHKIFNKHIDVNLKTPFFLIQKFLEYLNKKGIVINIIDQRVKNITPYFTSYTLSKVGLYALTKSLSVSLAPNVRVNGISPGPTLKSKNQTEKQFKKQILRTPLKKQVSLDEINNAIDYFLMNKSVTGEILTIDSGQSLGWAHSKSKVFIND